MQITSSRIQRPMTSAAPQAKPEANSQAESAPSDKVTFGLGLEDSPTAFYLATGTVVASAGAAAYYGGTGVASLLPSYGSGVLGAVSGVIMGGLSGGMTGNLISKASNTLFPTDQAGKAMTEGLYTFGCAAAGAVVGGIAGYFGAPALAVAPATIVSGLGGGAAAAVALSPLMND